MKHLEHIGIAVKNLDEANKRFTDLLNTVPYKIEGVESEHVITSFFKVGKTKVELLEATSSESPIHNFIIKRGEGIHHIAFAVEDIEAEIERLGSLGFRILQPAPRKGADKKLVAFLHPESAHGVLIEICQDILEEEE